MFAVSIIVVLLASFLLGSIPWGVVISKVFYHIDVRDYGSGNIGTTNSFRAMGKVGGSVVFALDFLKGLLSGLVAHGAIAFCTQQYLGEMTGGLMQIVPGNFPELYILYGVCFFGCVMGHMFSPWLHFHGGKGIAVAVGCLSIVFHGWGALIEFCIWLLLVLVTKYVSVGSIVAAALVPILSCYYYTQVYPCPWAILLFLAAGGMCVWAHRGNIQRLKNHTESRIGGSKSEA